jgi:hypothetical protein
MRCKFLEIQFVFAVGTPVWYCPSAYRQQKDSLVTIMEPSGVWRVAVPVWVSRLGDESVT